MRYAIILAGILAWFCVVFAPAAHPDLVTLRDGRPLLGEVKSASEEEFTMHLFDGGQLTVPWERVIERDVLRLQKRFGFIADEEAELTVPGVRIVLEDGNVFEGALLEPKRPDSVHLKLADGPREFPSSRIVSVEEVDVSALEAYTPRQLYQRHVDEHGEPQTPQGHMDFAAHSQRIGDYEKALEHLETLQEEFPEFKAEGVRLQKEAVLVIRSQQEAISLFDEVRAAAHRKQYDRAMAALEKLQADFPESPILEKVERYGLTSERLVAARRELDRERVASRYFYWMRDVAMDKAREEELTLSEVKSYAQREMADDISERVASSEQFTAEEVKELWAERESFLKRRTSYGNGTFLVEKPKKKAKPSTQNRGRDRRGRRNNSRDDGPKIERKPPTADEWWMRARPNERRDWLLSFYAEHSSDVNVKRTDYKQCLRCGGAGSLSVLGQTGGSQAIICDRCWGLGVDKVVVFQ